MSDTMSIDEVEKRLRDSAGEEAEARWRAEEQRKAANVEASTRSFLANEEYIRSRIGDDERAGVRHAEIMAEFSRQSDAMLRIAAALEAMVVR
jgi:hypothetical protein